jgi:predicted lysophospholipase L1 biosynthesis ABC-type transport system permease subunit
VILVAVGLGAFFIIGVRSLQSGLLREFSVDLRSGGVDLFLIDIQRDQAPPLRQFLDARFDPAPPLTCCPLRAGDRCARQQTNLERYEDVRGRGSWRANT